MGRTQRALTSLVAAIPSGFLAYTLVMVFLNQADSLSTITKILVGITLACAALITLMPFALLIFGGKKAAGADDDQSVASKSSADVDEIESVEAEDLDVADVEEDSDGGSAFDVDDSDAEIMSDSDDEITGPASSLDEIVSVDFEDEEPAPAPKKKPKR